MPFNNMMTVLPDNREDAPDCVNCVNILLHVPRIVLDARAIAKLCIWFMLRCLHPLTHSLTYLLTHSLTFN